MRCVSGLRIRPFGIAIRLFPARMARLVAPARMARLAALAALGIVLIAPPASAQNLLDFLLSGFRRPTPAAPAAAVLPNPGTLDPMRPEGPLAQGSGGKVSAYCVRLCDGRFFPVQGRERAGADNMCHAFCPASATKTFVGSAINHARAHDGQAYTDLANAYVFREKLVADCTCNGRDALGLAPVDISLDTTLRQGDMVATTDGILAYQGERAALNGKPEFTPIANYQGLPVSQRTQLGDIKVAPSITALIEDDTMSAPETTGTIATAPRRPVMR